MRDWIKQSYGPIFTAAGLRRLKFMILDFDRDYLPDFPRTVRIQAKNMQIFNKFIIHCQILEDSEANQYVDGIALHWYADTVDPSVVTETHVEFPDKFILYTESCEGTYGDTATRVQLGNWERAENYLHDIIEVL